MPTVQATQRLIAVNSESKDFDIYLKYCVSPLGADFCQGDEVGEYDGKLIGEYVSIVLPNGSKAYTKSENVR